MNESPTEEPTGIDSTAGAIGRQRGHRCFGRVVRRRPCAGRLCRTAADWPLAQYDSRRQSRPGVAMRRLHRRGAALQLRRRQNQA